MARKFKVILAVIALIFAGVLILKNRPEPVSGEPIKIGAIFMLTGTGAQWGQNSQKGADLAVEQVNAQGGISGKALEIIYEDNQGDNPKVAVSALNKFIAQGIKIILGPNWTPSGLATAPIACEKRILMISPSLGVGDFNEACDYLFNLWPHDDLLSERLGHFVIEQGHKRVAILGSLQEWEKVQAEAVKKGVEKAGGEVVVFLLPQKEEKDFRVEAVKIKESKPDAIVFTNFAFEHLSAKRLRELGVSAPFFSILMDDKRIKGADGAFENAIIITSFTPSPEFIGAFVEKYNEQPDIGSDTSYDAVMLIADAIRKTNSTNPIFLKDYLNSLNSYSGMSGLLKFDGKGGGTKEPQFKIVKEGKLEKYEGP